MTIIKADSIDVKIQYVQRRIIILSMIFIVTLQSPNFLGVSKAEGDWAIIKPTGDYSENVTNISYIGEQQLEVNAYFEQNCTNWNIDIHSGLFSWDIGGITFETVEAGYTFSTWIPINPSAQPGTYNFVIYQNYSLDDGTKIFNEFNYTITHVKSLEISSVHIPNYGDENFSLEVETFIEFDEIFVEFNPDGDIEVITENISVNNVSRGKHIFETEIYRGEYNAWDDQELGYWITAKIGNRTVLFSV